MNKGSGERNIVSDIILEEIKQSINSIDFGDVLIKVHAGRVIQIEVTDKKRFDDLWELEDGGGI
ncbi:MAG: hypothetical protein A4E57_01767 [Syntrophorhabdaceae bacterium PtaU1.Bin034]|jgi:hypothetical protein|nr:MAG: hypothetical protein A4E57_01767 [Syntrophorhabdaceae bacterium PtaU1.Bin034]